MDIAEMHVNFRQYAQQMGMQNVRAILPEQIDILINQSITDTVNQLIRENIGVTNDRIVTDNSKIGQINAFRTLYDVREVNISFTDQFLKTTTIITTDRESGTSTTSTNTEIVNTRGTDSDETDSSGSYETRTIIKYTPLAPLFTYNTQDRLQGLIKHVNSNDDEYDAVFGKYMFLVDISINYHAESDDDIITAWYPVRIIDSAYLADTLNDFILKNRFRSPIACIYKDDTIELYIDKFAVGTTPKVKIKSGTSTINLTPNKLRIDLVKYPAIVKFVEDIGGESVNCDLPESMHGDIVKHAVDLYRNALMGGRQPQQQEATNQPNQ